MFTTITTFIRKDAVRLALHYYASFIYLGLSAALTGPTLPALAQQFGVSLGQMGFWFLLSATGFMFGTLLGGKLLERFPGHILMGTGQIIGALLMIIIPIIPSFPLFLAVAFGKGIADGLLNVSNTLIVWTQGKNSAPYINALHFSFGLGAFVSPLLLARLINIPLGYRMAFWIIGAIGLLIGLRLLLLQGSPRAPFTHSQNLEQAGTKYYPLVIAAGLFLFFYAGAEMTFTGWVFTFATTLNISTAAEAAYLTSAFWLFFTFGRLISIPIATRFRPQQVITAASLGCLAALIILLTFGHSVTFLWVGTVTFGLCMAPLWPTGYAMAGQTINLTAQFSALILVESSLGGVILPWLVGQIFDRVGVGVMLPLVLASLILNFAVFLVFQKMASRLEKAPRPA